MPVRHLFHSLSWRADTCYALKDIVHQIVGNNTYSSYIYCEVFGANLISGVCDTLYCDEFLGYVSQTLTILPCYSPPAIRLQWLVELDDVPPYYLSRFYLDRVFTTTDSVSVMIGHLTATANVILGHKNNAIGLQVSSKQWTEQWLICDVL